MKILFVCHRFPYPPNRGGKIRPFNMIRHLSQKHDVVVGSLAHSVEELQEGSGLKEYCTEIIAEVLPETLRWVRAGQALLGAIPSSVAYFCSPRLRLRIEAAARKTKFDAVVVHCAFAAQYGLPIAARFRLMDFGDLDSGKWEDYSPCKAFPVSLGYRLEARKLRRYEKKLAAAFDYCTLTTSGELDEFKKLGILRPCAVIPNGVDGRFFNASGRIPGKTPVVVFLGRMDYFPNIDGIVYFTRAILPKIRMRIPEAEIRIIGSDPALEVRRLGEIPGVLVTGHVPDVRPYLRDAAVSVAPLRMAKGTQNKILESMAMGIPVVATPEAAKGIQAKPRKHFLLGDSPESFASEVIKILQSPDLRACLSEAGRKRVEEAHAWPASMKILDDILRKAAPTAGAGDIGEVRRYGRKSSVPS